MRTTWKFAVIVSAVALVVSCGNGDPNPSQSTSPTPTSTETNAVFYFVADTPLGFKLFQETHVVNTLQPIAIEALNRLVDGSESPIDPDYTNLWGNGSCVSGLTIVDELATVDFGKVSLNVGSSAEIMAIEQIVWTLTANNPAIEKVRFTLNGEPMESLAGHVDTTGTFTRGEGYEVLSAVNILIPADSSVLSGSVTVSGLACTFEANVAWKLLQDGDVVDSGSTLSAEACPVTAPWEVELGLLETGNYEFQALEYSMKDGSLAAIDTKTFVIE